MASLPKVEGRNQAAATLLLDCVVLTELLETVIAIQTRMKVEHDVDLFSENV